ncbi:MAG: AmmeMemoRadiSam system radical SAM enzyme [Desulfovibrionaceae bacterium]|nr:AmmeMemoRadiSam system radical SAM enzyme [Desulfovibrionaceae bacterium]MBF0513382.1 AmmeMemoRadiSam system radical SAM enzyme [Desulfovibrionaceae bacterium]
MREAGFYAKQAGGDAQCFLCAHRCLVKPGKRGLCGVRENQGGTLYSLVYGRLVSASVDPIEKKPLYHYLPGTTSYSIATMGCNFRCLFCQNYSISQPPRERGAIAGRETSPAAVVAEAERAGCASIAYTYVEPTIFMEYALDVAALAREQGLGNVFVSNGYMTAEALAALAPALDAANVDLKAFRDSFYRDNCGARLAPVLDTLTAMKRLGVWLEVTTLIIAGLNDDPGELAELAAFLAALGPETPWHVSAFHPAFRMADRPPTPPEAVLRARDIGLAAGLRNVYAGNIRGFGGENTVCRRCASTLVERAGYAIRKTGLAGAACADCGEIMDGRLGIGAGRAPGPPKGDRP